MKRADLPMIGFLAGYAGFIWLQDRAWVGAPEDALPLLMALVVLGWFGAPWRLSSDASRLPLRPTAAAIVLAILGFISGLNLLFALSWSAALWTWLSPRVEPARRRYLFRLLPLAVLSFPWLTLDFPILAWWFRLSAAWTVEHVFVVLGFTVQRAGTQLLVAQMPFDLSPACAGIRGLQSLWIGGTLLSLLQLGGSRWYWHSLALIPLVAWLANTCRVVLIFVAALSAGSEFATGWFHPVAGTLTLIGACVGLWFGLEAVAGARPLRGVSGEQDHKP